MIKLFLIQLFLSATIYDTEYQHVIDLGYNIPATTYIVSKNSGYDLVHNIVYLTSREYSTEVFDEIQYKDKENGYYFSSACFPEDGYIRSQSRHEIAHVIEYRGNLFKDGRWFFIIRNIDVKRSISLYATESPREAFAEAFSMYTSPLYGTKIKRLPKSVEDYLNSIKRKT